MGSVSSPGRSGIPKRVWGQGAPPRRGSKNPLDDQCGLRATGSAGLSECATWLTTCIWQCLRPARLPTVCTGPFGLQVALVLQPQRINDCFGRERTSARLQLGQQRPLAAAHSGRQERRLCSGCGRSMVAAQFPVSAPRAVIEPRDV